MTDRIILTYDVEVFPNCFMVTLKKHGTGLDTCTLYPLHGEDDKLRDLIDLFAHSGYTFVGYNNRHFDDQLINFLIAHRRRVVGMPRQDLCRELYELAQAIIDRKNSKYKYQNYFESIDLMQVGGLFRKSLKMVAISLGWPLIQDFPYDHNHHIQPDELSELRDYNINDVEITEELHDVLEGDINLRYWINENYGVDVTTQAEQQVADTLLEKMYAERTGVPPYVFTKRKTTYDQPISGSDMVSDIVSFETPSFQRLLTDLKEAQIDPGQRFQKDVRLNEMTYTVAKGGLHSVNRPEIIEREPGMLLLDADVASYYPFLVFTQEFCPAHMDRTFLDLLKEITLTRIEYKKAGKYTEADALKIVINAIYGKTRDENSWLFDQKVTYSVTLNGQLFLLMLIEDLELAGFEVVYANTDGVIAKVPEDRRSEYEAICEDWMATTSMDLDYDEFELLALRDVNSYIFQKSNGKVKRKGWLDRNATQGAWGLRKSLKTPVVPIAIEELILNGTPVEDTIYGHENVYDFCMAQRPGSQFDVYYETVEGQKIVRKQLQRSNRYYIGVRGGSLLKIRRGTGKESVFTGTKGWPVRLLNNAPTEEDRRLVNERYYIQEAKKVTSDILDRQLTLF